MVATSYVKWNKLWICLSTMLTQVQMTFSEQSNCQLNAECRLNVKYDTDSENDILVQSFWFWWHFRRAAWAAFCMENREKYFVYSNLQIYLIKRITWTCIWVALCIFRPSPLNDIMFLLWIAIQIFQGCSKIPYSNCWWSEMLLKWLQWLQNCQNQCQLMGLQSTQNYL